MERSRQEEAKRERGEKRKKQEDSELIRWRKDKPMVDCTLDPVRLICSTRKVNKGLDVCQGRQN